MHATMAREAATQPFRGGRHHRHIGDQNDQPTRSSSSTRVVGIAVMIYLYSSSVRVYIYFHTLRRIIQLYL